MKFHVSVIRALLESHSEDGTDIPVESSQTPARGKLEFIAFVLWYIAMILCCVVPTCCAYRRRRRLMRQIHTRRRSMEMLLQQQQEAAAAEVIEATAMLGSSRASNFFIWTDASGALRYGGMNQVLALESVEGEFACGERTKRLEAAMKDATFVVEEGDIINLKNSDNPEGNSTDAEPSGAQTSNEENHETQDEQKYDPGVGDKDEKDIELGAALDIDESNTELRLPIGRKDCKQKDIDGHDNTDFGSRTVPGVCAICLCSYEVGDRVTYSEGVSTLRSEEDIESGSSSSSRCPHAFHTDCIVQWLAKKNDPRPECPCCRRPFCSVAPLTNADLISHNSATTAHGTASFPGTTVSSSTAGARPRAIPMRTMHQLPMVALPINNNDNRGISNDQEGPVMLLLPWP